MAMSLNEYDEKVYAGVLGKVIGVYMGRPVEGWKKSVIEERLGTISGYVHEERGVPLVVSDDDITGTFTFIRALEDSGKFADTPAEFFGDMWLDYLIENRTVLWWGGMGHSTEHTAYLRLKNGVRAPMSGSMELNGKTVAEQIGAQIFIDAFGLVAPGNPTLAADMAKKSASVSHDGEAVYAAMVVAAMVSRAFESNDMDDIIQTALAFIPDDCLIAAVHRDVREWVAADKDWRATYDRIDEKYGYHIYGGNCHVIPNHALMVMAWLVAPDDFYESQRIINTAGWDTDCNAANVGSVMGVKLGLSRICERYDFISPFNDRLILPTADGTRSISDCAIEARHIAKIGRKIMGWEPLPDVKDGAWHHFIFPGSLHGWMPENDDFPSRHAAELSHDSSSGSTGMMVAFDISSGKRARISTPVTHREGGGHYAIVGTPKIVPGHAVRVNGTAVDVNSSKPVSIALFVRTHGDQSPFNAAPFYSDPVELIPGRPIDITIAIPDCQGWPVQDLGVELTSTARASGHIKIERVTILGKPDFRVELPPIGELLPRTNCHALPGWILDADFTRGAFSDDPEPVRRIGKNAGIGFAVTGTTDWTDYTFSARMSIHLATRAGIVARYKGLKRWIGLIQTGDTIQLIRSHYTETVLAEAKRQWEPDALYEFKLTCAGPRISAYIDGELLFEEEDDVLDSGGAGVLVDTGLIGFRDVAVY